MATPSLIVFDVNETLLGLETMEPTFERIFGERSAMRLWFAHLIPYSAPAPWLAATSLSPISERR